MKTINTDRGFRVILHKKYASESGEYERLVQESSAVGVDLDSPGSSFLWIGENHHLNREEIAELIAKLQYWLDNKRLP